MFWTSLTATTVRLIPVKKIYKFFGFMAFIKVTVSCKLKIMWNKLRALNRKKCTKQNVLMKKFEQVFLGNFGKIPFISYKLIS